MNVKQIRQLAQILRECGLTALEVSEGETHILLKKEPAPIAAAPAMAAPLPALPEAAPAPEPVQGVNFAEAAEIKAPMPGIFYAAPSPNAEPFVKVGSRVKKGDVVCIIEAMKLMNEITADRDGEIVDVCLTDGAIVEYGQALFKVN